MSTVIYFSTMISERYLTRLSLTMSGTKADTASLLANSGPGRVSFDSRVRKQKSIRTMGRKKTLEINLTLS